MSSGARRCKSEGHGYQLKIGIVPDLLLEAEDYSPDTRVFRDAAHQWAL
jgi:hypothetical protein